MISWLSDYINVALSGKLPLWAILSIIVIILCSFMAIFCKRAESDLPTVIYNWTLVIVCFGSIIHLLQGGNPLQQLQALLVAIAAKKIWNTFLIFKN